MLRALISETEVEIEEDNHVQMGIVFPGPILLLRNVKFNENYSTHAVTQTCGNIILTVSRLPGMLKASAGQT